MRTYGVVIGQPIQGETRAARKLGYHTKRRERTKLIMALKGPLELFCCRAHSKVVQNHVALCTSRIRGDREGETRVEDAFRTLMKRYRSKKRHTSV